MIIGVPSNDFGGQEPGGASDIVKTANHHYGVTFPLTEKVDVKGPKPTRSTNGRWSQRPLDTPRWNFHKYLIGRNGHIVAAFPTAVEPTDPRVAAAIEAELAATG